MSLVGYRYVKENYNGTVLGFGKIRERAFPEVYLTFHSKVIEGSKVLPPKLELLSVEFFTGGGITFFPAFDEGLLDLLCLRGIDITTEEYPT